MLTLECIQCSQGYTEADIFQNKFFPETRVCYACYKRMQKASFEVSCFGKKSKNGKLGFDSMSVECMEYCPDRVLCPSFIRNKFIIIASVPTEVKAKEEITTRLYPFRQNSIIGRAFKLCQSGTTKAKLKSWCAKKGTNYYWLSRILKRGSKHGKQWLWDESGVNIRLDYPIR